jgi:polysaccharide biosynthesis transport protein
MSPGDQDDQNRQADLERAHSVLRRRYKLILLCCVIIGGAVWGLSQLQTKEYSASASLLFRNPGFAEDLFGTTAVAPTPTEANREAATNKTLVGLEIVGARAARKLPGLSPKEVSNMVTVSAEGEADVVSVTATSPDPAQAKLVANTVARQFISFRAETDKSKLLQAKQLSERALRRLSPAERSGPRGQALSRGAEKLGILASLQTGNAELVQPASLPDSPSSPKPIRNGIIGAILGLLGGIGLAFLLERLSTKLRSPEEAQDIFELPILATIPESKAIMSTNEGSSAPDLPFAENESFRMLRASLRYFNVDSNVKSVLVTSYSSGIGKSTVSWNLARVAASSSRVVLVETDLRNPSLSNQHGLPVIGGLGALLTHQITLDEAIHRKPIALQGAGTNGSSAEDRHLDVIVAGPPPPNPAELLESQTMNEVLEELKSRYDLVVIDTAPLGVVSDAFPLLRRVDGVIAVTRLGTSTRDHAEHLRDQLRRLEAPVLGLVVNAVRIGRREKYGYGYYGGYYGKPAEAPEQTPASR